MGSGTERAMWLRKRLMVARKDKKMTQQDVADAIARDLNLTSLSKQTVSLWEKFETQPDMTTLAAWARAVGLRLSVGLIDPEDPREEVRVRASTVAMVHRFEVLSAEHRAAIATLIDGLPSVESES